MSEKRGKGERDMINELSTSGKCQFLTPPRGSTMAKEFPRDESHDMNMIVNNVFSSAQANHSDRFIPKRNSPLTRQLFNLPEHILASPSDISNKSEKEHNSIIFENILEQKLLHMKQEMQTDKAKDPIDMPNNIFNSAKSQGPIASKAQTTPVKKMGEPQFVVKRPKLLNFSDRKDDKLNDDDSKAESVFDSKIIKNIRHFRKISKSPYKILDSPGLLDDFYQNILDWSANDVIAIALSNILYFWTNNTQENNVIKVDELQDMSAFYCSLKWDPTGAKIATGSDSGLLEITDAAKFVCTDSVHCHSNRISSMSWKNPNILSTGSRDNTIKTYDIRTKLSNSTAVLQKHNQEVCGLKWSQNGTYLASGGNDNIINIWDHRKSEVPILSFNEHKAAVRALAWSPHHYGTLLSGGGNNDKSLKFWNITTGTLTNSVETESQICNLAFSTHSNEFVTTHGFSGNQIMIWNGSTVERIAVLEGHISRVLHLAVSPDSESIATAAADETLKFWKVFPRPEMLPVIDSKDIFMQLR